MPLVCFLFIVFLINNSTIDLVPLFLIVAAAVVFFFCLNFFVDSICMLIQALKQMPKKQHTSKNY